MTTVIAAAAGICPVTNFATKPEAVFIVAIIKLLPMAIRVGTLSTYINNGTKTKFPAPRKPITTPAVKEKKNKNHPDLKFSGKLLPDFRQCGNIMNVTNNATIQQHQQNHLSPRCDAAARRPAQVNAWTAIGPCTAAAKSPANQRGEKYLAYDDSGDSFCVELRQTNQRRNVIQERKHQDPAAETEQPGGKSAKDAETGQGDDEQNAHDPMPALEASKISTRVARKYPMLT
jgi:hypothetical protein